MALAAGSGVVAGAPVDEAAEAAAAMSSILRSTVFKQREERESVRCSRLEARRECGRIQQSHWSKGAIWNSDLRFALFLKALPGATLQSPHSTLPVRLADPPMVRKPVNHPIQPAAVAWVRSDADL
jgi:hypothetical protein